MRRKTVRGGRIYANPHVVKHIPILSHIEGHSNIKSPWINKTDRIVQDVLIEIWACK